MRLNQASDFALRILIQLASKNEAVTIKTISDELGLVNSHVMKIAAKLRQAGFIHSQRGRMGGVSLARPVKEITIGQVVRAIETDFAIVECMQNSQSNCTFIKNCKLRNTIQKATDAFLSTLDAQTLQDLVAQD